MYKTKGRTEWSALFCLFYYERIRPTIILKHFCLPHHRWSNTAYKKITHLTLACKPSTLAWYARATEASMYKLTQWAMGWRSVTSTKATSPHRMQVLGHPAISGRQVLCHAWSFNPIPSFDFLMGKNNGSSSRSTMRRNEHHCALHFQSHPSLPIVFLVLLSRIKLVCCFT